MAQLAPAQDLKNASWVYPFKGVYFFVSNPFLYPLLHSRLIPAFILSVVVFVSLFVWAYLPQVAFLALFHGKGAWPNAAFAVLGEGMAITSLLFEAFLVDETQVDVFDAVLVHQGFSNLVAVSRPVDANETDPYKRLGKPTSKSSVYYPFSFRQIFEFIILIPLNFIPWIGIPLFLWLTGYRAGPLQGWRYYQLREFTRKERNAWIRSKRLRYTAFGCVCLTLQLIPILSMFFLLTNAAGSALWHAELEGERLEALAAAEEDGALADERVEGQEGLAAGVGGEQADAEEPLVGAFAGERQDDDEEEESSSPPPPYAPFRDADD